MNRTDRLYALTEELRAVSPRPRSGSWLARHFEVSVRTIERDVGALQDAGVPVLAESGRSGGYVLDPAWSLPLIAVTPREVLAVAVGVRALAGTAFQEPARSGLHRMLAALPRSELARLRLLMRPEVHRLEYHDESGVASVRDVEPLGLMGGAEHWYVIAWCRLRSAIRGFRLDRVVAVTPTGEPLPERRIALAGLVVPGREVETLDLADPVPPLPVAV
jgi:predicted DNA-binding transcriptional regulator YafY